MKKIMRRVGILIFSIAFAVKCYGQEIIWKTGIFSYFDNREYFNDYVNPQTYLGSQGYGQFGFKLDDHHEFAAGVNIIYEYGSAFNSDLISPIIYYHFNKDFLKLYMGSFAREKLVSLPNVLLFDTIQYFRPNVEGIFFELKNKRGYQNLWLDWTSRQTETERETFSIGGTGILKSNALFCRYDFILTHIAGPSIPIPDDHIRDNGGLYSGIGISLSKHTLFDSLSLSTGYTMSYDRLRNVYALNYRSGSITELNVLYRQFGLKSTTYFGQGQTQIAGDGFYAANFYNRIDLLWNVFRKKYIQGKVEFSFHILEDVLDFSQRFTILADIGGGKNIESSQSMR